MLSTSRLQAEAFDFIARNGLQAVRQEITTLCQKYTLTQVADIGCGTGLLVRDLRKEGLQAIGLDACSDMLHVARRNLGIASSPASHTANTSLTDIFTLADGAALPLQPGSMDVLTYSFMLHATDTPDTILQEGLRVCSRVIIADWYAPERNLDYLTTWWPTVIEFCAGKEHFGQYKRFVSQGGVRGLVHRAGAVVIEEKLLLGSACMLALCQKK